MYLSFLLLKSSIPENPYGVMKKASMDRQSNQARRHFFFIILFMRMLDSSPHHHAVPQLNNPMCRLGQFGVVGDEDDGEAVALVQFLQDRADLVAAG